MKIKGLKTTLGLAGASIGMGIVGNAFNSTGLSNAGAVTAGFVPVAANISGAATVLDMIKKLKPKKK